MKRFGYFIPQFVTDFLIYLRIIFKYRRSIKQIYDNRNLYNSKKGKSVYLIANGPSLNNFKIDSLYGNDVIVMNHFELAEWKEKVNIVAHCIGEPFKAPAWEDPGPMILNTNSENYWFHISAKDDVMMNYASSGKKFNFFLSAIPAGLWKNGKRINLAKPTLGYQTTAQMGLMVGLYMGYSKLYLLGFDHDWLCQRNISPHFYAERENVPKADLSKFTYFELIKFSLNMWSIYLKIKSSATTSGTRIINLSRPTYLDVFDYE
jgi:hypothetical protein